MKKKHHLQLDPISLPEPNAAVCARDLTYQLIGQGNWVSLYYTHNKYIYMYINILCV